MFELSVMKETIKLSVMKETIKTTSYDLEAELPGLGWSKGGCSADSLQGQPKQIYIFNMQVYTFKN